ncbi:hypothetical protein [Sporohalobacter salinus]|nr:hypothetical protein [Sporohalobacter salinus]MBM7623423.1 hypothetical protein [Sporohalobacter salinus]
MKYIVKVDLIYIFIRSVAQYLVIVDGTLASSTLKLKLNIVEL